MLVAWEVGSSYLPNMTFFRVCLQELIFHFGLLSCSMGYKVGPHPPGCQWGETTPITRWWFQIFFMFTRTWGRFPFWLIFFRWVETTNQIRCVLTLRCSCHLSARSKKVGVFEPLKKPMFFTGSAFRAHHGGHRSPKASWPQKMPSKPGRIG